jgi:SAM-dependent methyltransferase
MPGHPFNRRRQIARRFVRGNGIEIGALHQPLPLPRNAKARYVDRMTVPELRSHYPELRDCALVRVDVIDDGEILGSVSDASVDFVIASHLLEHCQDPIGSIASWLRVLRPRGILYLAVPDKRHTFDRDRPVTPLEHLIRDHREGPAWSRHSHFEEWARLAERVPAAGIDEHVDRLMSTDYSIHFHVWTEAELLEMLLHCRRGEKFPFGFELFQRNGFESVAILRKNS